MATPTNEKLMTKSRSRQQQADWQVDFTQRDERLRPGLRRYVKDLGHCTVIWHPLCVTSFSPNHAALVHQIIDERKLLLAKAIQGKDWDAVVSLHAPPFKFKAFIDYCYPIDDATYWRLLGEGWRTQESIHPNTESYLNLFSSPRKERHRRMLVDERQDFERLPKELLVYRGFLGRGAKGISWTLDREVAEWFAIRWQVVFPSKQPKLASGVVKKSDVLGYFTARNEREVVVDPRSIKSLKIENLS